MVQPFCLLLWSSALLLGRKEWERETLSVGDNMCGNTKLNKKKKREKVGGEEIKRCMKTAVITLRRADIKAKVKNMTKGQNS